MYSNYKFYSGQAPADTQGKGELKPVEAEVFERASFWPLLQAKLETGKKYIDIGCASGGWVIYLTDRDYHIEGLDLNAGLIKKLKHYRSDITWREGNVLDLPLENSSYDGILALGVLEYPQNNVDQALAELHRILKPGGWIIIQVPLANYLRRLLYLPLKKLHHLWQTAKGKQPVFIHYFFTPKDIKKAANAAGFTVEKIQPHDWTLPGHHAGLWIDWPLLRGGDKRRLNPLGRIIEKVCRTISPWVASTGFVITARKLSESRH